MRTPLHSRIPSAFNALRSCIASFDSTGTGCDLCCGGSGAGCAELGSLRFFSLSALLEFCGTNSSSLSELPDVWEFSELSDDSGGLRCTMCDARFF
jgi:hypothetical protein